MVFKLDNIVPWGRSLTEYTAMFALDEADFRGRILDCGAGPSSFNAELSRTGGRVVSCDPLYQHTREEIESRIRKTYADVLAETMAHQNSFLWTAIKSPEELGRIRMTAMNQFLADFEAGKDEGRYRPDALPLLPFPDQAFDLALSSHFLFLYSDILSWEFHHQSVLEMCRAAREVRIFPLLGLDGNTSVYLSRLRQALEGFFACDVVRVGYEFQKGAFEMLRIRRLDGHHPGGGA